MPSCARSAAQDSAPSHGSGPEQAVRLDDGIGGIRSLMAAACTQAGVPGKGIDRVVGHYLDGELRGKPSHGLAKCAFESQFFSQTIGTPGTKRERGAMAVADTSGAKSVRSAPTSPSVSSPARRVA
ncbi:hypothetical protein ACIGO6_33530 [Streptomyces sp. NPDC053750]|uniref:hypothetical protein n=1 Tax=Streptomyces sp. NPDC053750 TaxID=3365714 RepID=UPI0037D92AC4